MAKGFDRDGGDMHTINRREFCLAGTLGACALPGKSAGPPPRTPNIVLILADDLGFGDVHFLNPDRGRLPTPNIDRLASEGMSFSDAHSGSAVCSPTRYGILTGRYAWRSKLQRGVLAPYDAPLIPSGRITLPAMLKSRGYATACIGKWHLGWDWPRVNGKVAFDQRIPGGPTAVGFDSYFGTDVPNYPPYCFIENDRTLGIPSIPKPKTIYGTDGEMLPGWRLDAILPALTERACKFVRHCSEEKKPFFLYLPLTSPHTPLAVDSAWRGKSGLGLYGDWVMQTDFAAGEVLRAIEQSGARDNTLVMFTSDNGCAPYIGVDYEAENTRQGRVKELEAKGHYPSAGFRGYKSDIWEGGHRIPFVARWPGVVKAGSRSDQTICLTDILATCAEATGGHVPEAAGEDSVSFVPALRGGAVKSAREAIVHHSIGGQFAIRRGKWKLALCAGSGGWTSPTEAQAVKQGLPPVQLYDLHADPAETNNLAVKHREEVTRLTRLMEQYVNAGRSRTGPKQSNDVVVNLHKPVNESTQGSD
jgi:arylsulfatase A-like enzyme